MAEIGRLDRLLGDGRIGMGRGICGSRRDVGREKPVLVNLVASAASIETAFGYAAMMAQSPQTIGYALADLPVAMAAYYYARFAEWTDSDGQPESIFRYDEMLDAISLYWLNDTGASSSRSYREGARAGSGPFSGVVIPTLPVAVTVFPAERPEFFSHELRAAFGGLRQGHGDLART